MKRYALLLLLGLCAACGSYKAVRPDAPRAAVAVDDVEGYTPAMQDYLDYIRNPANGYVSATLKPYKALEYSVKTGEVAAA